MIYFEAPTEEYPDDPYKATVFMGWVSEDLDSGVLDSGTVLRCHTPSPDTLTATIFSFDLP